MKHQQLATRTKTILLFLFLAAFSFNGLNAQSTIGRQKIDQFASNTWGGSVYGLTWLPADYASNNNTYPLIIFLHGAGEAGSGIGGLYTLLNAAIPQKIANGWDPQAVNPVDGQTYKFIVVSPQAPQWSSNAQMLQSIVPDILSKYRVDLSRIYVTGLSAGGAGTWACVTNGSSFAQYFSAVVPVSAAGTNTPTEAAQLPLVGGTYGEKVWSICGTGDSFWTLATSYTNIINTASPVPGTPALVTGLPGGHDGSVWNTAYDPSWRSNTQNKNIYEWMLQYKKGTVASIPIPVVTTPTAPAAVALPGKVEAENYTAMSGVQKEGTSDVGGGENVGYIDNGDWMDYSVNPSAAGAYTVSFRIASPSSGAQFQLRKSDGTMLATVNVPNTGGWQTWQTVTANVTLAAGTQTLRIVSTAAANWNINWFSFAQGSTPVVTTPTTPTTPAATSARIEAENWSNMSGVQAESTSDVGGGENVGWIDNGDWMDYSINPSTTGSYTVSFRIASPSSGAQFQLRKSDGTVLATVNVPNTGGWQTWQTVTANVTLAAGQQTVRIVSTAAANWNINWWEYAPASTTTTTTPTNTNTTPASGYTAIPAKIEAENWANMNGVQTENTSDAGGGLNVGWIDYMDWMEYNISVPAAGSYPLSLRIATPNSNAQLQIRRADGTVLTTVSLPNTGGYQTWQTVTVPVTLAGGNQSIRIVCTGGGSFNINWLQFAAASSGLMANNTTSESVATSDALSTAQVEVYPNPVVNQFVLKVSNNLQGTLNVAIVDLSGAVKKSFSLQKTTAAAQQFYLSIGELPQGQYMLKATMTGWNESAQVIKQ